MRSSRVWRPSPERDGALESKLRQSFTRRPRRPIRHHPFFYAPISNSTSFLISIENAKTFTMVKFYDSSFSYDYSFPAVTLAYFLRYPNPYSTHVLSTDVIERRFDPDTQELHTVRLHLKRSKLPAAVLKILPRSLLGASSQGDTQSYILEHSVVNIREGWMDTVSQNLEWTGVLSVVERQIFRRPADIFRSNNCQKSAAAHGLLEAGPNETTDVQTTVTLHSKIGENIRKRRAARAAADAKAAELEEEQPPKPGFFKSWSTASIQRSIELIGLKRAEKSQPNAKEGMKIVLQRMRQGGLVAVLEGMRQDREKILMGHAPPAASRNGNDFNDRS